jgi:hypothetical protein
MRNIAVGATIMALLWPATSQAAPKPLKVWLYGDGESGRLLSELDGGINDPNITNIRVLRKSPMESSGPTALGTRPVLAIRLINDLAGVPAQDRPNLIHIGYNASADSWFYCAIAGLSMFPDSTWMQGVQETAGSEARAINDAATWATAFQLRVLLSKGPGAASQNAVAKAPLIATTPQEKIARRCMATAFNLVSFFLAVLNDSAYPWVDFSGFSVDSRLGGAPVTAWQLDPMNVLHWEQDGIHVSTNKLKYDSMDPPRRPIVGYAGSFDVGTPPPKVPQATLGAYRVAKNVFRAYQSIQSQL